MANYTNIITFNTTLIHTTNEDNSSHYLRINLLLNNTKFISQLSLMVESAVSLLKYLNLNVSF